MHMHAMAACPADVTLASCMHAIVFLLAPCNVTGSDWEVEEGDKVVARKAGYIFKLINLNFSCKSSRMHMQICLLFK